MSLLLRRLAGAVSAPLRRSLCTAASRPPWAMVYSKVALGASGAPSPGARASFDLDAAPYVSNISVPAHLADGMDLADAAVRATSSDGLLLLDLAETRHLSAPPDILESFDSRVLQEMAVACAASSLDVTRFVCNPLSGELFRLPVPDMDVVPDTNSAFGLLTKSDDGSHGPPDRYVVAQLGCRPGAAGNRVVVRRFLSETGEWDERQPLPCFVPSRMPRWQPIQIHTSHDVLPFGDRLWWFDVTWGAFSLDPFSDRPDIRFVELPWDSVLSNVETGEKMLLGKSRIMGVSEGKLRYVELYTKREPWLIRSFSLDDEGCCWNLTLQNTITLVNLPNKMKPQAEQLPWITAIDPFNANILYCHINRTSFAMDLAKREIIGDRSFPDSIPGRSMYSSNFYLPCVLPIWLESTCIPCAGTLSRKKTNRKRKTLADILVRADRD